jgi:large subunit ribosomal protein L6
MMEKIEIPEKVNVEVKGAMVIVKCNDSELSREFFFPGVTISVQGKEVVIESKKDSKSFKRLVYTFRAHINNMIRGVQKHYVYRLKVRFVHFPISVQQKGNEVIIKNFMGEKSDRKTRIMDGVKMEISGDEITLSGPDKEKVGQSAANIENAARVKGYDRRVFQDGIFIVSKGDDGG